jgi:hypothetical protein
VTGLLERPSRKDVGVTRKVPVTGILVLLAGIAFGLAAGMVVTGRGVDDVRRLGNEAPGHTIPPSLPGDEHMADALRVCNESATVNARAAAS